MKLGSRAFAVPAAVATFALALTLGAVALDDGDENRQRDVASRGANVMPFDLDATTHRFVKRRFGGLQVVVADRPGDRREVGLIREHLREEARAFARGDFDDPATIHGSAMPGLTTLRQSAGKLAIDVVDRPDGAQLVFRTKEIEVRDALHAWFDAQLSDHGEHAEG